MTVRPLVSRNDDRTISIEWWGPRHVVHVMLTRYRWWIQVYVGKTIRNVT